MGFLWWFAVVALAEMATFFWISSEIGLGPAILIALTTALVGALMVKRAGVAVWRSIRARVREQKVPGRELAAGAAVLVAGAFLISPGFITDVLGFALLVPAVQDRLYRIVTQRLAGRFETLRAASQRYAQDQGAWTVEVVDVDEND
ncbi:MAG: FxsA family protein [Acidimicrobiia bacterium]|nr:FxsA family protein [Acidimicrobiia bacterium]